MASKIPFELQPAETVLRTEVAVWIQGGLKNRMGSIWLTNKRLLFVKMNPFLAPLFGLLGFLLDHFLSKNRQPALDMPLRDIMSFEHSSFGLNKKVILFHTRQGEIKLGLNKSYEEWEPVLKGAMKK